MKVYLDDGEPTPFSLVNGCLVSLAAILVLLLGGCLFVRISEAQSVRADLPPQLEASYFIDIDACSRLFGGYSYIARISPDAARDLGREGQGWLAQPAGYPIDDGKAAPWRSAEGFEWDYDGPPSGLQCLREWEVDGRKIKDHIYRKGSYYRSYHRRQADYVIPSLGVVVGGFDPR